MKKIVKGIVKVRMKCLFIGDPHIRIENFDAYDKLTALISNIVKEHKISLIIVGGDVLHYHERLHTLALNRALDFLVQMGRMCRVICLVGNHDMINNQQFLTENHWMKHYKDRLPNVEIIDTVRGFDIDGFRFMCCPYVYPGRFVEALDTYTDMNWQDADIIFAHQEFKGCRMGAIISETGDEWNPEWPQVVSGHIHDYQKPLPNIFYPGTPMQHSFGDKGDNIILLIDTESGIKFTEIPTEVDKKKTIYSTIDDIGDVLDRGVRSTEKEKVKVSIKGTAEEFKVFKDSAEYKRLVKAGVTVAFKQDPKRRPEGEEHADQSDFYEILHSLLEKSGNKRVMSDYKSVFYDSSDFIVLE